MTDADKLREWLKKMDGEAQCTEEELLISICRKLLDALDCCAERRGFKMEDIRLGIEETKRETSRRAIAECITFLGDDANNNS